MSILTWGKHCNVYLARGPCPACIWEKIIFEENDGCLFTCFEIWQLFVYNLDPLAVQWATWLKPTVNTKFEAVLIMDACNVVGDPWRALLKAWSIKRLVVIKNTPRTIWIKMSGSWKLKLEYVHIMSVQEKYNTYRDIFFFEYCIR